MASSFAGNPIFVIGDGGLPRTSGADVNVRHIPGGNTSYVDIGGRQLQSLTITLLFTLDADAINFESLQGTVGTLITVDGTRLAVLVSTTRTSRGLGINGETQLSCVFTLL